MSDGNLLHNVYPPVKEEAQLGGEANLTIAQMKFIMQMYDHSIPLLTTSDIMTKLVGKVFLTVTSREPQYQMI